MRSYVGSKANKQWIWLAIDATRRASCRGIYWRLRKAQCRRQSLSANQQNNCGVREITGNLPTPDSVLEFLYLTKSLGRSPNTKAAYQKDINDFFREMTGYLATPDSVLEFLHVTESQGRSPFRQRLPHPITTRSTKLKPLHNRLQDVEGHCNCIIVAYDAQAVGNARGGGEALRGMSAMVRH